MNRRISILILIIILILTACGNADIPDPVAEPSEDNHNRHTHQFPNGKTNANASPTKIGLVFAFVPGAPMV